MVQMGFEVKLESSVDFLSSYGLAIIVLISLLSAAFLIIKSQPINSCVSPPDFSCSYASMSTDGFLLVKISQAVGEPVLINGIACADQQNATDLTVYMVVFLLYWL